MYLKTDCLIFDIETGGHDEAVLRELYTPPTFDEFAAGCDQRWKTETVKAKFLDAKLSGWQAFVDKAALSPLTGHVLVIGVCRGDGEAGVMDGGEADNELELLCDFWTAYNSGFADSKLIGFNIFGFDLPFLIRRSWIHGIMVPETVFDGRYWSDTFIDLMKVWGLGNNREFVKLNTLAKTFGLPCKTGSGADFARLWHGTDEERAEAVKYAKRDVEITRDLAVKMQVIE